VVVVENGVLAVEAVVAARSSARPFDLVLMDIQMPIMGGVEAVRAIRRTGSRIPILAMTANTDEEDLRSYLEAGMDGVVAKPVKPAVLFQEIDRVVPSRPVTA
ncbi:MAG: response regulator, partial [Planctomycetes bacterium]|nr:response regulator [Planctomycetota bacterium]